MLRRRKRVTCARCNASHPAIYETHSCLICGSTIDAASGQRKHAGTKASGKHNTKKRQTEIAASQRNGDGMSAAPAVPARRGGVSAAAYEWQVTLAAKGLAERDNHPMPKSVTTPEAFYEVMAAAALDATDHRALLERATRAEQELETIRHALRRADIEAKDARHQRRSDEVER
jgi:hypothetical protein